MIRRTFIARNILVLVTTHLEGGLINNADQRRAHDVLVTTHLEGGLICATSLPCASLVLVTTHLEGGLIVRRVRLQMV